MKKTENRSIVFCLLATVIFSLHFSLASAVIPADSLISNGNRHYMNREYELAANCYLEVVASGYESGELYYNLGNACYKQDKLAEAILYYEKALLFNPGDEDIRQNLALVNARIIDKIDSIPDFFLKKWVKNMQGILSSDQWAMLSIVLFLLAMSSFLWFAISDRVNVRKVSFSFGMALLVFSMSGLLLMHGRMQKMQKSNHAIIMKSSVNARSSPDEQSTNVFVLHEGTKVELLDSIQNWKEIGIANGNKGWVPDEAVGEI